MHIIRTTVLASLTALGIACLASTPASAALTYGPSGVCPTTAGHASFGGGGTGNATDCNLFITFNANGSITTTAGPQTTYDNIEDALIGVINNTGSAITHFNLTGSDIFGFDGDGIDGYANGGPISPVAGNPDLTTYGGLDAYFTNLIGNDSGTVNFANGGIAGNGGHDFFSLEEPASLSLVVSQVPEPLTLSLFGAGLAGAVLIRRKKKSA